MGETEGTTSTSRRSALLALLLLVPAPSFGTWFAMVYAEGTWYGQAAFFAVKLWILILPVVWLIRSGHKPRIPRLSGRGMLAAVITGSLIFNFIAAGYWFVALPFDLITPDEARTMADKAKEIGLDTPLIYILGALYWCTVNSILEEYVWRWFVFTRCEAIVNRYAAVFLSALLFTLHHIIALRVYFDVDVTILALGVFIGGATWSWLYLRYRNIYAAYVSHVFADVIIFAIGYLMIFGTPHKFRDTNTAGPYHEGGPPCWAADSLIAMPSPEASLMELAMDRLKVTQPLVMVVVIIGALFAGAVVAPVRADDKTALTFKEVVQMRIKRKSHDEVVETARIRGVAFAVDENMAARLKRMMFSKEQIDLLKKIHDDPNGFDEPADDGAADKPGMDQGGKDVFEVKPNAPFGPRKPKNWHAKQLQMAGQIAKAADPTFAFVKNKDFTIWGSKNTLVSHVNDLRRLEALAGKTWGGVYKQGLNPDSAHLVLCDTRYIYEQYVEAMFDIFAKNGIKFGGQDPKQMAIKSAGFSTSTTAVVDLTRFKPPDASRRSVAHNAGKMYMTQLTEGRAPDALVSGFGNVCETRMYGNPTVMTQSYDLRELQGGDGWAKMVAKLITDQQISDPRTIITRYSMESMQPPNYAEAWSLTEALAGGTTQFETITHLMRDGTDAMKAIEDTYKVDNQALFRKWVQSVK